MGVSSSHKISDDSDSDNNSQYESFESDMENYNEYMASDALHSERIFSQLPRHLTDNDIQLIDNCLDLEDKISLIYLLYENPHTALQQMIVLIKNGNANIVEEWYLYEKKLNPKWEYKLLEALTIMQHYKILRILGTKKDEMILIYQPLNVASLQIKQVRKSCYRICENFDNKKTQRFLERVTQDFEEKHLIHAPIMKYNVDYLETYFLYLETEKYISLYDIENVAKIFKYMDLDNYYDQFQELDNRLKECRPRSNYNIDKTPGFENAIINSPERSFSIKEEESSSEAIGDIYDINPERPGVILIINNEDFYTECRPEFTELLPKTDLKLENRKGTESDYTKLQETFRKLRFNVIPKKNRIHEVMLEDIKEVVEKFQDSSLFIAILSHGDQGVVYGANSIPLDVVEIQKLMCQPHLSQIPKVLLLQSCQGTDCQEIDDNGYETDGPRKKYNLPKTTDLLTFRATIQGYAAVRHTKKGSWFIQTFCEKIENNPSDDIQEICRKVIKEVSSKKWGTKCMVPLLETTFTKRLHYSMVQ